MRPRKLSDHGRLVIEAVARIRARLPTDKDLMREHGVSRAYICKLMKAVRSRLVGKSDQRETSADVSVDLAQLTDLERLADEVRAARLNRETTSSGPITPRPYKHPPRPKTAIISEASQQALATRRWLERKG